MNTVMASHLPAAPVWPGRPVGAPRPPSSDTPPLIALRDVSKRFTTHPDLALRLAMALKLAQPPQVVAAVDQVSIEVRKGEVVGLVGESGCGKSTVGRLAVGLHAPTSGQQLWQGVPFGDLSSPERRQMRQRVQMVFQDPSASLNPRMRTADIVSEAALAHGLVQPAERGEFVASLLSQVGLDPALARRFPHEFSGGQRARIGIARAISTRAEFLVCDEAVAALDVSIQAQVINLFGRLRAELGLSYLFISHDLGVVRHISDRVVIMYLGRVVESAPTDDLFRHPVHPYAQGLLAGAPSLETRKRDYLPIRGEIPSPLSPPAGCHFHPRCPHAMPRCKVEAPALKSVAPAHAAACHLV